MGVKASFNEITKIITITLAPDASGEVFIDVKTDLYSDGKEDWVLNENLRKFAFPIRSVGGDDLPGSKALGATFFLASDWKIRPYEASHKLTINGNLYSEDGSDPFLDTLGTFTVRIIQQVSSLVDSTVQQLTDIEYASFGGGVTIDVINGVPGVGEAGNPIGNIQNPSNNLTDTMVIANNRGFTVIFVKGDLTIDSGYDYTGMTFEGESPIKSELTVSSAANVLDCEFYNAYITGTLDGNCVLMNCRIDDLDYIHGVIEQCIIDPGVIQLGGTENALFLDCWAGARETSVSKIIDCGGSGQGLALRNYNGGIVLRNKTGDDHVSIDLNSGRVGLENTVVSGTISVRGVGDLFDYDTNENIPTGVWNGVTIDNNTISNKIIADAVYNEVGAEIQYASFGSRVTIDVINGVSGTEYNIGTLENPVNNLPNAVSIADTRGFHTFYINESMSFDSGTDINNFNIIGRSRTKTEIIIDPSAICNGLGIERCNVSGTLDGDARIRDCNVGDLTYVNGHILDSNLYGTVMLAGNEDAYLKDCGSLKNALPPIFDMGGSGQDCVLHDYSGGAKFRNMTGANKIGIQMDGGKIWLESTLTSGVVNINGLGQVDDKSGDGCIVNTDGLMSKQTISKAVWDEPVANHLEDGSTGLSVGMSEFNGVVTVDTAGVSGTVYPIGTEKSPVNNIVDAETIAVSRGISSLKFDSNFTFDSTTNISYYNLIGSGFGNTTFTFQSGCVVAYCSTVDAKITGLSLGLTSMSNCLVSNYGGSGLLPSNKDVTLNNCILEGSLSVPSNYTGILKAIRCYSGGTAEENPAIIDANGADYTMIARGYSGAIKIINNTSSGSYYSLDFGSGRIELDNTITAGVFKIRGSGLLSDNSTGTVIINSDGLISKDTIARAAWDEPVANHLIEDTMGHEMYHIAYNDMVCIDVVNGISGTNFPAGTRHSPVNNINDASIIADNHNYRYLHVIGSVTVSGGEDISGYTVISDRNLGNEVIVTNGITSETYFQDITVRGTMNGSVYYTNCVLGDINNFDGGAKNSLITGNIDITGTNSNYLTDCDVYTTDFTFKQINVGNKLFNLIRCRGPFEITNYTGVTAVTIDLVSGMIRVASSCVSGMIIISGLVNVIDLSGPACVVMDNSLTETGIANVVLDENIYDHTISGSLGSTVGKMKKETGLIPALV